MRRHTALILAALLLAPAAFAQHAVQPYAGQQARGVKSLSDDEVKAFLDGRGQGLARPAELNAYPGPMHVLELADKIELTAEQRAATEALIAPMQQEARRHGAAYIDREREIDALFAARTADPKALREKLRESAAALARVRAAHLEAHIAQVAILTPKQIAAYQRLRGYSDSGAAHHGRH